MCQRFLLKLFSICSAMSLRSIGDDRRASIRADHVDSGDSSQCPSKDIKQREVSSPTSSFIAYMQWRKTSDIASVLQNF